ncbi:MAG: hypothetical protein ACRD99_06825 [Nitrososphaera sp.]
MDNNSQVSTYNVSMEASEDLGVKIDFLMASYNSIYLGARKAAPQQFSNELVISQDGRVKTTFHIRVSNRMAPYLIKAIQDQTKPDYGVALKGYYHKLQDQIMAQMFSNVGELSFPKFG